MCREVHLLLVPLVFLSGSATFLDGLGMDGLLAAYRHIYEDPCLLGDTGRPGRRYGLPDSLSVIVND